MSTASDHSSPVIHLPFNQSPGHACRALHQPIARDGFKSDIIAGDAAELGDVAGRLTAIVEQERPAASPRQRNIEKPPFLGVLEFLWPWDHQIEEFVILDPAGYAIVAFADVHEDRVICLQAF